MWSIAIVGALVVACGAQPAKPHAPSVVEVPVAAGSEFAFVITEPPPSTPFTVTLIDAGNEPRHARRYRFPQNATQAFEADVRFATSISVDGEVEHAVELPTLRINGRLASAQHRPSGNLPFVYVFDRCELLDDVTLGPADRKGYEADVASLVGATASGFVSPRGVANVELTFARRVPQSLNALTKTLSDVFGAPFVLLPVEPIGSGARWEARNRVHVGSVVTDFRQVLSLIETDDGGATIAVETELVGAPGQPVREVGASATLGTLRMTAGGRIHPFYSQLVTGGAAYASEMTTAVASDTTSGRVERTTRTRLLFSVVQPPPDRQ